MHGPVPEATQSTTVCINYICTAHEWPDVISTSTNQCHASTCSLPRSGSPTLHSDSSPPLAYTCFMMSIFVKYLNALI